MAQLTLKKAKRPERPKLLVALYGPSLGGKTLLASTLPGSIMLFDAGGRFMEQAGQRDDVFEVYETAKENARIQNITTALAQVMPQSAAQIENIVVDDFTFAFQTLIDEQEAMPTSGPGSREAKGFKAKVMKNFRRELFGYGKNVLLIYHTHRAGDGRSDDIVERKTVSDIEIARTDMFTNLTLRVVVDKNGKHGVTIERNRFGHTGITVWDDSNCWDGFWEKLQAEAYKGLSWDDMRKIASSIPETFTDKPAAWAWGTEQGCFKDIAHAANAMEKLAREHELLDGSELWTAWVADVQRRKKEVDSTSFSDGDQAIAWGVSQGAFYTLEASRAAYLALKAEKKPATAREMFAIWIGLVNSLIDAKQPEQETPETTAAPAVVVVVAEAAPAPTEAPTVAPEAPQQPDVEPITWMRQNMPAEVNAYVEQVLAATDSKKASSAQIATLRFALAEAAGWNGDADHALHGVTKIEWLANILAGRTGGDLALYPAGAFKLIGGSIIKEMGGKVNAGYSAERVAMVKQAADVVDAAYQVYNVTT